MRVAVVVVARNEERYIAETLKSLRMQTFPPELIVVVNDGSTDRTGEIAREMGCYVVDLPFHEESYTGRPELAKVWNEGLRVVREKGGFDYVLLLGADHPLPPTYIEDLLSRIQGNPNIVVASGRIEGERYSENAPRGSGRIVNVDFWVKASNMQYPIGWGWESWLYFKALQMGYEVKCFTDIVTQTLRPTGLRKAGMWGKAMWALGYDWKYALGRCLLTFMKSPKAGLEMFYGWITHKDVERLDVAEFVNKMQKKNFWKKIKQILKYPTYKTNKNSLHY